MTTRLTRWCVAAATLALALGALAVAPAQAAPPSSAKSRHDQVVSFWTNDKIKQAKPRGYDLNTSTGKFTPTRQTTATAAPKASGTTASWNGGGAVLKTTGKVFFAMPDGYYVCSASVVKDAIADRSIILTAGHCVFDNATSQFSSMWMFVPDYDSNPVNLDKAGAFCAQTTYGCWTATSIVASSGFTAQKSFNTTATLNDFAFVVVGAGGKNMAQLDATVGAQNISFAKASTGITAYSFGYPAGAPYTGKDLTYSSSKLAMDARNASKTYQIASTMTGGCSGGPWFQNFSASTGTGTLFSVNSYGYGTNSTTMQGPVLNAKAQSMFKAAATSVGNVAM